MKKDEDYEIDSLSCELAVKVYKLTMSLPKFEIYEEETQIRRFSKSITTNIIEEYERKKYKADYRSRLINRELYITRQQN